MHKRSLATTIRGSGIKQETRSFGSFTEDLEGFRDCLKANGITHVAMESTGVYWKPVFNVLEEDLEVILANAWHIKNALGRKTNKADDR